jgi:hypothetical protein
MRTILLIILAATLGGVIACGSADEGGPAYLQTRAAAGKPPMLDSVTHIQVIPPPVKTDAGMQAHPRTVTDPDSIAAIVSFVSRRASAWKSKRGLRETPRGSLILDFYTGPALVATVVDRGRNISLQGYKVGLIQKLPRPEKATLAALVGIPGER